MILTTTYDVDISKPLLPTPLQQMLITKDKKANRIAVNLFNGATPFEPGGTCTGFAVRRDGLPVPIENGVVSGSQMYIDLPEDAYELEGPISIGIKNVNTSEGTETTIFLGLGVVSLGETDTVIDPGTIIPSVSALIAAIDEAVESIPSDYSILSDMMDALTHVDLTEAGYISPSGAEVNYANYKRTGWIPVSADSTLILDGFYTGIGASAYYFYAADKTGISGATSITTRTVVDTIPSGAAYVRFSSRTGNGETPVAYVSNNVVAIIAARMNGTLSDFKAYVGFV